MKILVLTKMKPSEVTFDAIRAVAPDAEIIRANSMAAAEKALPEAEVIITTKSEFPREAVALAPQLKWVHSLMVGVESFLYPEFIQRGIILTNPRGAADICVSEHVMALLLGWARSIDKFIRMQMNRKWERLPVNHIRGRTLGIIGLGSIGREIARKAKLAFGMKVIATKKRLTEEEYVDEVLPAGRLDDLLQAADYIVVAAAMVEETKDLLGEREFKLMKPNAFVVNIARGKIIQEAALARALREKWIAGAGIDVFETEPLPDDSELWQLDNIIITPHLAGLSSQNLADLRIGVFTENLKRYVRGEGLLTQVDFKLGY